MGMQKWMRKSAKINAKLRVGTFLHPDTRIGAGMLRARDRLNRQRQINHLRVNGGMERNAAIAHLDQSLLAKVVAAVKPKRSKKAETV